MGYCDDCPDREACHQGMSCDLSRRFAFAARLYQQKMKGNPTNMSTSKNDKVTTPKDVADKAVEEKLVVPTQTGSAVITEEGVSVDEEKTNVDSSGDAEGNIKKSLKDRLSEVTSKVKQHKKALAATVGVVAVATIAVAKYAKKQAESAVTDEEKAEQERLYEETKQALGVDDSAA